MTANNFGDPEFLRSVRYKHEAPTYAVRTHLLNTYKVMSKSFPASVLITPARGKTFVEM
ncbi:MAG: hypothetical protein WKF97_13040 [Chitinophagaceae bacterium]